MYFARGGFNYYVYVSNSSIRYHDPSGLTACDVKAAISVAKSIYSDCLENTGFYKGSTGEDAWGYANILTNNIFINSFFFDDKLNRRELLLLLATMIHEARHIQDGPLKTLFLSDKDHSELNRRAENQAMYDFVNFTRTRNNMLVGGACGK